MQSVPQTIRELGKLISPVFTGSANRSALKRLAWQGAVASIIGLGLCVSSILAVSAGLQALMPSEIIASALKETVDFASWLVDSKAAATVITLAAVSGVFVMAKARQYTNQQRQAWLYAVGIIYLILLSSAIEVGLSYIASSLNTAFSSKNEAGALQTIIAIASILAIALPIAFAYSVTEQSFQNYWRSFMSASLLDKYLTNKSFYKISAGLTEDGTRIDNPDQRIAQDTDEFTAETSQLITELIRTFIAAASFSLVLWSVSRLAFGLIIGYAAAGTLAARLVGRRLLSLNYKQLEYDADFRYSITQVRDNAESIAFYCGETQENDRLKRNLKQAITNKYVLIRNVAGLATFNLGFNQIQAFLPFALLWIPYFRGEISFGQIIQAATAIASVAAAFNFFAINYNSIVNLLANASRLEELFEALKKIDQNTQAVDSKDLSANQVIQTHKASLQVPNSKRLLVQKLDLDIKPTDRILIVGPSGCGKTSLLRMMAGLWQPLEGECRAKTFRDGVIFVPQRSYLFTATLNNLLNYPNQTASLGRHELQHLLERVNLPQLLEQHPDLEQAVEWQRVLSVGEQQRIAFARVLLSKAQFALLDEASSALDPDNERRVYQLLQSAGMGYMSIGHRASLLNYHDQVLRLEPEGSWKLVPAADYAFNEQAPAH